MGRGGKSVDSLNRWVRPEAFLLSRVKRTWQPLAIRVWVGEEVKDDSKLLTTRQSGHIEGRAFEEINENHFGYVAFGSR